MKAWIWQNKHLLIQNDGPTAVTLAHETHGTADNDWCMPSSTSYLELAEQVHVAVMVGCHREETEDSS